ncbi:DUF2012 domain-containing protein [Hymenobacter sp. HMF4947]|uniref:DUF2012 domain-containing protein n=1 Tax=Hymenobacter ginkgonis TaxID=2682976 RepID=A0A7K1TMA9_9BACT|nr:carboxypeptidase-like regulatory domain-containing protein [Hymenobacter ginkgonis]MVN79261.1 DUF2012 domain-containing protein [Hymenobacter ginkgonis]
MKLAACCLSSVAFLLFQPFTGKCQVGQLAGQVNNSKGSGGFPGITVTLQHDGHTIAGTATNQDGTFSLSNLPVGTYDLVLEMIGYRTERQIGVSITTAQAARLTIPFPGPCPYTYPHHKLSVCMGGHTNHFIPIAYGLPTARMMQRAKQGKVYLGGCQVTGCDPKYYCPIHQKEL